MRSTWLGTVAAAALATGFTVTALPQVAHSQEAGETITISAQPLAAALADLNQQSGLQVAVPSDLATGVQSAAVSDISDPEAALSALLAGTGLTFEQTGDDTYVLVPVSADGSSSEILLDKILVRGGKIERSLLQTPNSVGIVTSEDIENYVIEDTFDSFNLLGNVRRLNTGGGNDSFQIRGLSADGISDIANSQPLVSLIIDGATQNSEGLRRGARSTWDLEQVEVLRGPQSGLYGRAALAGAVVLTSKDPTYFYEGALRGDAGTLDTLGGSFMVSGPIIEDQVALRFSGDLQKESKDITFTDPLNGFFADDEYRNLRAKLLIEPQEIPDLRMLFTFNGAYDRTASAAVTGPNFFDRVFDESGLASEGREATVNNYIANISYDLGESLTLRSISSLIDTDLEIFSAPASTVYFRSDLRDGQDITQEVVLEIEDQQGSGLSGVVGGFFGDFSTRTDSNIQADPGLQFTPPTSFGFLIPVQVGNSISQTQSFAIYTDLRYNFYGPWSVLGGLRYQRDSVRSASNIASLFGDTTFDVSATFDALLPKIGLSYDINEAQSVSAFASRGYRQGFSENILGTTDRNDVDAEYVWTYELAYRFVSPEGDISFAANAFFNDYSDQQISIVNPNFGFGNNTFNIGESRSYGAEFEGRYDFGNGLSIFGALGLLKTEITDLADAVCAPSGGNCDGNEFPEAPNVTAGFGGTYRHDNGFFVTGDASYTGSYFSNSDINNTPTREIDGYFLANASIGYEREHFQARLYVKNLFDNDYITTLESSLNSAAVGDSRIFGGEIYLRF
ncbi:MAG: TonB-dependent receptor [Pseudomonadota bacterium]